ncbi:MAG: hypothetical protein AB1673_16650 [Actinomycetota bacterium]
MAGLVLAGLLATTCDTSLPEGYIALDSDNPGALPALSVQPEDVPEGYAVGLYPGGDQTANEVTLNLCAAAFPSEALRIARRQVGVVDPRQELVMSTEAVAYQDEAATAQAFVELRAAQAGCSGALRRPSTGEVVGLVFGTPPDRDWPVVAGVERLAFDYHEVGETSPPARTVLVFLRRGRLLLGVYVYLKDGRPVPPVRGATSVEQIVEDFARRLAALPATVTR